MPPSAIETASVCDRALSVTRRSVLMRENDAVSSTTSIKLTRRAVGMANPRRALERMVVASLVDAVAEEDGGADERAVRRGGAAGGVLAPCREHELDPARVRQGTRHGALRAVRVEHEELEAQPLLEEHRRGDERAGGHRRTHDDVATAGERGDPGRRARGRAAGGEG